MSDILYIDRVTSEKRIEKVFHQETLDFLYEPKRINRLIADFTAKSSLFSKLVGCYQNLKCTKKDIPAFIEKFQVKAEEFEKTVDEFSSFNDFFTRKLKKDARPIVSGEMRAIIPADGRFLFYQDVETCDGFIVKGKKFSLATLLKNEKLAKGYSKGSMAIARLCPSDYHRFHFPVSCQPGIPKLINGPLYSVNPVAIKQNVNLLSENKRVITELKTDHFGTILFIEIGATSVGTIRQTYTPGHHYEKGEEKGFFSFGGSSIILLFEPGQIEFDADLLAASAQHTEILCLMGQSMGNKKKG